MNISRFTSLCLICLSVLCLLVLAPPAHAQQKSVVVERRDALVTILSNGDVRFAETWRVRFVGGPFRSAFRTIPLNHVREIDEWSVAENGQPYSERSNQNAGTFALRRGATERQITWYFSPTTNGERSFVLRYTLRSAVAVYPAGDQFYWKFIEADRQYPINASRVTLTLPATFTPGQLRAATYGDAGPGQSVGSGDGRTITFDGGPFPAGSQWEIRAQFPHGAITTGVPLWQRAEEHRPLLDLISLVVAMLILVCGMLALLVLWFDRGRDRPVGLKAEFIPAPPEGVPPGIVGTLIDKSADLQDIMATIVDLARRGKLRILESGFQFTFERLPVDTADLRPFELLVLERLFGHSVYASPADLRGTFYTALPELKNALYDEAIRMGYFAERPPRTKRRYLGFGIIALVLCSLAGVFGYPYVAIYLPLAIWSVFAAGVVALGLMLMSPWMARKTLRGAQATAKWKAFRRYLAQIDRYTQVAQARDQFELYLAYAIAFGLERGWVQRFAAVDAPVPNWYQSASDYSNPLFVGTSHHHSIYQADSGNGNGPSLGVPSLNGLSSGALVSLNAMSSSFFSMLNSTSAALVSRPEPVQPRVSAGSDNGWSGSDGGWSGGGGFGGGGGGGGSSGFN